MTPKQKAKELYDKFYEQVQHENHEADEADYMSRMCMEICINEIILSDENEHPSDIKVEYWEQVKEEITLI